MPMVLHVSTEGDVTVGEEALRRATVEPGGLIDNVMGRLLDDGFVEASGRTLSAETVLAHDYNYAQVLTLDLTMRGFHYHEVPITYHFRESGRSFVRLGRYLRRCVPAAWRVVNGRVDVPEPAVSV
mgnify:CR=1 FL=1